MDNTKQAIMNWMLDALERSDLPKEEQQRLGILGRREIENGGWRGDVSEIFKNEGYTTGDIPNLYL